MKNKKFIIIALIIIIVLAILMGILKPVYDSYVFKRYGHEDLIKYIQNIEDDEQRKNEIEKALNNKDITQKEAEELY